jgi:hypothetical protein
MTDVLGYLVTAALTAIVIGVGATSMEASRRTQVTLILALSLWFGLATAAGAAGLIAVNNPPATLPFFAAGPLVAGALAFTNADGRRVMQSLPFKVILGLNIGRVAGAFFLILSWQGRMGGVFPVSAGWGDVIAGVTAALILLTGADRSRGVLILWNLFGMLDLITAIVLGVTSTEGSPLQLIHVPPGSNLVEQPPWSLIPTVLVPYFLVMHGIGWAKLLRRTA